MKTFLKAGQVSLINGGYLSATEGEAPVFHPEFVQAQRGAEYVIKFAELAKDKDFKGKKADSLTDLKAELAELLSEDTSVEYVKAGKAPASKIGDALKSEALAFLDFKEKESKTEKINEFLQKFNVINDFEKHGLFFEQDIVKLNKLYTIKEIKAAVTSVIDLVD